jgi:membrane protein DedA with SNARE-associated domain
MIPFEIGLAAGPWAVVFGLILATFVNEDLACIAAGLLLAAGKIEWLPAIAGCFLGIILGDLGVWLLGRAAGMRAMHWNWVRKILTPDRLERLAAQLCQHGGRTAFLARGLPGTRVPLFLAAGILGFCPARFLTWAFLAAALWTPALIFTVVIAGDSILDRGWPTIAAVGMVIFIGWNIVPLLFTPIDRAKLLARVSKLWRWEFWPAWLFYLPLVPWYLGLAVRHRSFTLWTAANPGIPAGGVVGESKADILDRLPVEFAMPTRLVPPGPFETRRELFRLAIAREDWTYPLILKPDAGQRGVGVQKVNDEADAFDYLRRNPASVIVQPYHAGPFELGIFYVRLPTQSTGRIFSITEKVFPVLIGDGRSTLEELIWSHPRFRMQAGLFLARHAGEAGRVLAPGESFPLTVAGNHCQGTLFRDGGHWYTSELERSIDAVARTFDGFYFGRFDVRFADPVAVRAGRGYSILELNGATSESTNLYDPAGTLFGAYGTLFRQWSLAFAIGAENRRRGHRPIGLVTLIRLIARFYLARQTICDRIHPTAARDIPTTTFRPVDYHRMTS